MNQQKNTIAVLFTCFNRKEKTLSCVESLLKQNDMPRFDLYICDDASTDGTVEAVLQIFPKAVIIPGTGNLFWSRGMHAAMEAAVKTEYEYYLMVNDDVEFMPTMWNSMISAYQNNSECGVSGCTVSKMTREQTYGGSKFISSSKGDYVGPMLAPTQQEYAQCDLANWNCFLVGRGVVNRVGIIDEIYEHAMGDFDYSLRMRKVGFPIILAKDYVGYCENNTVLNTFKDSHLSRKIRLQKLFAANGLPVKSWYHFTMNYYMNGKIRNLIMPYIKYILCIIFRLDCK